MKTIQEICAMAPVIPVLVIDDLDTAIPLAETLVKGGLPVLEVTLRTPVALQAIELMSQVTGAIVGVGTVLGAKDVVAAKIAGAQFAVSPGVTDELLSAVENEQLPLLPGASTASEVMKLRDMGYKTLKLFPAEAVGGVNLLKSLAGPLPDITFCPTGGVGLHNCADYLSLSNVLCVGGSWIAPKDKVNACDWDSIESIAKQASNII